MKNIILLEGGQAVQTITNFLQNRKSVREFRDKKANAETIDRIKSAIEQIRNESSEKAVEFNFYEDGKSIAKELKGVGGYSGVMIESPHYIGLEFLNDDPKTMLYGAYYMEKLITLITEIELDTCWVTVKDVADSTLNRYNGKVDFLLALGYPKIKIPFFTEPETESERLSVTDIVYKDEVENPIEPEELQNMRLTDVFFNLRYAPSSYNTQPWRFLIKDHKVTLLYSHIGAESPRYVDIGIVMYYFEALANSKGIIGAWKLIDGEIEGSEASYTKIAQFAI